MDRCFSMKVSEYIRLEADHDPVNPDDEQDDTLSNHLQIIYSIMHFYKIHYPFTSETDNHVR
eukprot:5493081-Ditylum_brightwellii.AAC.1